MSDPTELIQEKTNGYLKKTEPDQFAFDCNPIRGYPELKWTGKRLDGVAVLLWAAHVLSFR